MGVYQVGKNWYFDFYYDGKRYKESVGAVNRTVAKEILTIKKREVIQGQYKPKAVHVDFSKLKVQYLEYSESNKKPSSVSRDEASIMHLETHFRGKRLSDIAPFTIERYKTARLAEGAAPRTVNIELSTLRAMFNQAMKWGKALSNPMREVELLKISESEDRILSADEEGRLFKAIRDGGKRAAHLEPIIVTALNTGMRKGEILNLKWANVNFKSGYIRVLNTKSGKNRDIPMNSTLTATLKNVKGKHSGEYVFCGETAFTDVKTAWQNVLKEAKIENFRFHDLRHTFGSRLSMAGIDIRTIQQLMGHADITMTMRYVHPTPEHRRKAVEVLTHTTFHTTRQIDKTEKVVSIGNH